jgi:hypothetical protein
LIILKTKEAEIKKFFANTPTNNKATRFFHTLFAQHVSTLNWILCGCSFTAENLEKFRQKLISFIRFLWVCNNDLFTYTCVCMLNEGFGRSGTDFVARIVFRALWIKPRLLTMS